MLNHLGAGGSKEARAHLSTTNKSYEGVVSDGLRHTGKRPNPTDVYVGSRVRMRRKMMGLSQEKLGDKLGITFQQIQKYEKGTNRVGASRLQAMATALEVPISYFFPDNASGAASGMRDDGSAFMMDFLSTSEGLDLSRAFTRVRSAKLRRKLVELVRAVADEQT